MHHAPDYALAEEVLHRIGVGDVAVDESEGPRFLQLREARFLQLRIVVRVEVVDADDLLPAIEQSLRNVESDEAGGAGHENQIGHNVIVRGEGKNEKPLV